MLSLSLRFAAVMKLTQGCLGKQHNKACLVFYQIINSTGLK